MMKAGFMHQGILQHEWNCASEKVSNLFHCRLVEALVILHRWLSFKRDELKTV